MWPVTNADSLFVRLNSIGNAVIELLIALAVIYIVWSSVQFIRNAGGEKRGEYQMAIIWGIVGLFVIISIWGIVNILGGTFGLGNSWNTGRSSGDIHSLIIPQ